LNFAFNCGASVATLIPTRGGNGALEALAASGQFSPPKLTTLEAAWTSASACGGGEYFADLWDLEQFLDCPVCFPQRAARLREINFSQQPLPSVPLHPIRGALEK